MYREPALPTEAVDLAHVVSPSSWWRRRADRLEAYLGARVVVGGGAYTSLDGRRRVRFESSDSRARFEELDPDLGITRRSHRVRTCASFELRRSRVATAVWHAPVLGRSTSQVCFTGVPRQLGGEPKATFASLVRLFEHADGVRIDRLSATGNLAGDSRHASLADALRQLEHEYANHLGELRSGWGQLDREAHRAWSGYGPSFFDL